MIPSLYIHIPFCKKKCFYCNFRSDVYNEADAFDYIDILCREISRLDRKFSTVYIGGGTPTVLGKDLLTKLLNSVQECINYSTEFTVEANPESLNEDTLELFLDKGVNRLSIGVQSFDDGKLKKLGRIHSAEIAKETVLVAHKKGFRNISIDLIFGVYDEDFEIWKKELKIAASLPVTHISSYGLSYEDGTFLSDMLKKNKIKALEDTVVSKMYDYTVDYLLQHDYSRYEVSNFAKARYHCRHNLNYWQNNSYIGLGVSAVSYINGKRKENTSNIKEYISKARDGNNLTVFDEELSAIDRAKETAALKIRTDEGIDFEWFKEKTGFDFLDLESDSLENLAQDGLIVGVREGGIRLTTKGFLFCDIVSGSLL